MSIDSSRFQVRDLATAADARNDVAGILLPPPDIDVAEAAELYRVLSNPQGYSGPYRHALAPQLVRPMQALTDILYEIIVFVAPAQSGKTEIGLNFCCHSVRVDPGDFQIVLPEKQQAEDFSERRLGRMIDASPELGDRERSRSKFLAVFDQCMVNLSWPTSANASSKPVSRNWLDERDSMDDDIDGEGDPAALYHKRSQTFGPRRKTLVTSSPKRAKVKGSAKPTGAHEAVNTEASLALYNEGTRRLMYWPCRDCGEFFVTRVEHLHYPDGATSSDARIEVWFTCPHCGSIHTEDDRHALFSRHEWLAEGQAIDKHGNVTGEVRVTNIDSYRLFGPQAAFITLEELVRKRLKAEEHRERTGSDTELRTFWNVDAGEVYDGAAESEAISPDDLKKAAQDLPLGIFPPWGALVVAAVDVQIDRFEPMWQVIGPNGEAAIVDHSKIVAIGPGNRAISLGGGSASVLAANGVQSCDPALEFDHWLSLVDAVFDRPLPLAGDPSRGIVPHIVVIDTGGAAGVTDKAYKFSRWLKRNRPDLHRRAMFVKGRDGTHPLGVQLAQWDERAANRRSSNRRGVALWNVWVDGLKDSVAAALKSAIKNAGTSGPNRLHVSTHLPPAVFEQLCAESRDEDGHWENERRVSNEAWDLAVYCLAGVIAAQITKVVWANPPDWAIAHKNTVPTGHTDEATPGLTTHTPPPAVRVARQRGTRGQIRA